METNTERGRARVVAAAIVGLCLMIGTAAGGFFVGKGATRFRSETRSVTVKGLVEKDVKSDQAVWRIGLRRAADDVKSAQARIAADRDAVIAFLQKQGFRTEEIGREPTRTIDKLAREYGQPQGGERPRYIITSSLVVKSANVDLVREALGATDQLVAVGVVLDGEREGVANPRYVVAKFNELRPALLAEATRNARATAQQFAADAGARIGKIRSANQGMIQIFGEDGNDESGPFSPTSTVAKKIRVVSTFEFDLE